MNKKRELWIDSIKVFACVLVALGHFFQGIISADLVLKTPVLTWFDSTIYYFHVPLFFICSGFLCQRKFNLWKVNAVTKAISLGVPYFVFSIITWIFKNIFSGAVNSQVRGLFDTLFLNPSSPYWYLYALFFIYLLIPVFKNKKSMTFFVAALVVCKLLSIVFNDIEIYAVSTVMKNGIWFVMGMLMAYCGFVDKIKNKFNYYIGIVLAIIFIIISIFVYDVESNFLSFVMGVIACAAVVILFINWFSKDEHRFINILSKYTMPVFLMHTIFSAGLRGVLLKLGITNSIIHIVLGISISFIGPILAAQIMSLLKLDILYNPLKYIRKKRMTNVEKA